MEWLSSVCPLIQTSCSKGRDEHSGARLNNVTLGLSAHEQDYIALLRLYTQPIIEVFPNHCSVIRLTLQFAGRVDEVTRSLNYPLSSVLHHIIYSRRPHLNTTSSAPELGIDPWLQIRAMNSTPSSCFYLSSTTSRISRHSVGVKYVRSGRKALKHA